MPPNTPSSNNLDSNDSNLPSNQDDSTSSTIDTSIPPLSSNTPITKTSSVQSSPPQQAPLEVELNQSSSIKKYVKFLFETILVLGFLGFIIIGYLVFSDEGVYTEEEIIAIARERIIPSIVQLRCFNEDGEESGIGTGSYYLDADGNPFVDTNAHVVLDSYGEYYGCNIYFPRPSDGSFYNSVYEAGDVFLYHDIKSKIDLVDTDPSNISVDTAYNFGIFGLSLGAAGVILAIIALIKRK